MALNAYTTKSVFSLGIKQAVQPNIDIAVNLTNDTTFTQPRNLYIGTGGDLKVLLWNSTVATTYKNIPSGFNFPCQVKTVYSTANGTTATDIISTWSI